MLLANRNVIAPLTRKRATDAMPTALMAECYSQRATAGLIISKATAISHPDQGYSDVPGLNGTKRRRRLGGGAAVAGGPHLALQLAA